MMYLEQRIEQLEKELSELKVIVHELRKAPGIKINAEGVTIKHSTHTNEYVLEFEGKQYKKVDRLARTGDVVVLKDNIATYSWLTIGKPYKVLKRDAEEGASIMGDDGDALKLYRDDSNYNRTPETVDVYELIVDKPKTANELRAEVIEKAKWFVKEAIRYGIDDGGSSIGSITNDLFDEFYVVEFYEKQKKITAVVTISNRNGIKKTNKPTCVGHSKCHPNAVFNKDIGKAIALGRALGLDVSEFEQAVQPTELVRGMYCTNTVGWKGKLTYSSKYGDVWYGTEGFELGSYYKNIKILNDTNVIYEVQNEN